MRIYSFCPGTCRRFCQAPSCSVSCHFRGIPVSPIFAAMPHTPCWTPDQTQPKPHQSRQCLEVSKRGLTYFLTCRWAAKLPNAKALPNVAGEGFPLCLRRGADPATDHDFQLITLPQLGCSHTLPSVRMPDDQILRSQNSGGHQYIEPRSEIVGQIPTRRHLPLDEAKLAGIKNQPPAAVQPGCWASDDGKSNKFCPEKGWVVLVDWQ